MIWVQFWWSICSSIWLLPNQIYSSSIYLKIFFFFFLLFGFHSLFFIFFFIFGSVGVLFFFGRAIMLRWFRHDVPVFIKFYNFFFTSNYILKSLYDNSLFFFFLMNMKIHCQLLLFIIKKDRCDHFILLNLYKIFIIM